VPLEGILSIKDEESAIDTRRRIESNDCPTMEKRFGASVLRYTGFEEIS
jgi:hypothetical protein